MSMTPVSGTNFALGGSFCGAGAFFSGAACVGLLAPFDLLVLRLQQPKHSVRLLFLFFSALEV